MIPLIKDISLILCLKTNNLEKNSESKKDKMFSVTLFNGNILIIHNNTRHFTFRLFDISNASYSETYLQNNNILINSDLRKMLTIQQNKWKGKPFKINCEPF